MAEIFGEAWPDWPAHDLDLIRQPIELLGVNYYTRNVTRFRPLMRGRSKLAQCARSIDLYRDGLGGICPRLD